MAIVKRFNVNTQQATLDADIIENMSANDVSYDSSFQYDENTVGNKLSELEYDVTKNNDGVTFASLSVLLSDENLSTLIPTSVRHGGMSICFVQSSDNKYVQYLYLVTSTTVSDFTNIDNWEKTNLKEELKQLQMNVGLPLSIDVNSMEKKNYMPDSINWYDKGTHCVIPVTVGDTYLISSQQQNYLAWLTSEYTQPSSASAVPYVSGTTRFKASTTDAKYIVPEGAAYLCFTKSEGGVICLYNVQQYKKNSLAKDLDLIEEVCSDFGTIVSGTIYRGELEYSDHALSNTFYFKVKPFSIIDIIRKSDIEVRITEYNASKMYIRQTEYTEIDSFTVGYTTEYIRISGRHPDMSKWSALDFDNDFGIKAVIPSYVNDVNKNLNSLTNYIKTVKYATDLSLEQRLTAFYTLGEVVIDNVNQKFKCTANIVTKIGTTEYIIPANTEVSYSTYYSDLINSIPCLVMDTQNLTFKVVGWRAAANERIILTFGTVTYKNEEVIIHNVAFSSVPYSIVNAPAPSEYPYEYYGERIDWGNNYYKISTYKNFGLGWNQSCVCYQNYFLSFENTNNTIRLHNLVDGSLLFTKSIYSGTYDIPHCNTACLGDALHSANSIMPLVYVSQWTAGQQRACFVYDVTLTEGVYDVTLVQVINLASISNNLIGAGACDFAIFQNKLYSISYKEKSSFFADGANKTLINAFELPSTANSEIILTDNDVLMTKELPLIYMRQDLHVNGGNIYIAGGGIDNDEQREERKITVLNTLSLEITSVIPLRNFSGEPEGLTEHLGNLIITNTGGILYKIEFK